MSKYEESEESLARIEEYEKLRLRGVKRVKQKCGLGKKCIGMERREKLMMYNNSAIRGHSENQEVGFAKLMGFLFLSL